VGLESDSCNSVCCGFNDNHRGDMDDDLRPKGAPDVLGRFNGGREYRRPQIAGTLMRHATAEAVGPIAVSVIATALLGTLVLTTRGSNLVVAG
jgi:hypothetical protein